MGNIVVWCLFIVQGILVFYYLYKNFCFKNIKLIIPLVVIILILLLISLNRALKVIELNKRYYTISVSLLSQFIIYNSFVKHKEDFKINTIRGCINYFCQRDMRWGFKKYSSSNFSSLGCIPTVIAMIASLKDKNITPLDVGKWLQNTNYITIDGTRMDAVVEYFHQLNIPYIIISKGDKQKLLDCIDDGYMFAILYKKHAVLAVKTNKKIIVLDPMKPNRMLLCNFNKFIDNVFKEEYISENSHPVIGINICI
ncbi:MAG: hypothetical protein GX757_09540 [Clostridiales bacterium]|nr:hypothetical protein [Clostridiales bacterium]